MKQPNIKDLVIDIEGSDEIRAAMAKVKKIKITINIDEDILRTVRKMSDRTGVPYQSLLNRILRGAVSRRKQTESRITRLEKEVSALKNRLPG